MSDDLTSAMNAYLSHYPDATDDLKKGIADALIDNIKRSIPNQSFGTFSSGPDDKKSDDKIRFVQEYLKSIGMTPTRVESYANSGTRMVHFERANQSPPDLAGSTQSSGTFADHVSKTVDRIASEKVRLYGIGSNPKLLTSDLNALQKIAERLSGDNDISFTDVGLEHAKFVPQVTVPDQNGRSHPDPDRPARWELSLEQAVKAGIVDGLKFQSLSERSAPVPVIHPHPAYGGGRLSTSVRARQATAQTPWEQSGNVDRSAVFTGRAEGDIPDLNNPPRWDSGGAGGIPPGGNDPPGPPDEPDDDGILRQLLEFFQRMFGVRPDIANRNFLDTLANNLTSILGGVPAQAGADGQRPSSVATLMDTFADYFGVPTRNEAERREAEENLTQAIDKLVNAIDGNTKTRTGVTSRAARTVNWLKRKAKVVGLKTARMAMRAARPFARRIGSIIPANIRTQMTRWGATIVGQQAVNLGVSPATAARFGAALGPAAALVGGFMLILPAIAKVASTLNEWAKTARENIDRVSKYSPQLTAAQVYLEANRRQRDIRLANAMGGLGADRLNAENMAENAAEPWTKFTDAIGNIWGTTLSTKDAIGSSMINQGFAFVPRIVELLASTTGKLDTIEGFARTAIDFWTNENVNKNADPFRASEMGAWLRNQASGPEAQAQRRRAREPLGPVK